MSLHYLASTMAEPSHPFRMVGFVVGKVAVLGLISWGIYRVVRGNRRARTAARAPHQQPLPPHATPYPPYASGPWGPAPGPYGPPMHPPTPPWPGQQSPWPPHHQQPVPVPTPRNR